MRRYETDEGMIHDDEIVAIKILLDRVLTEPKAEITIPPMIACHVYLIPPNGRLRA